MSKQEYDSEIDRKDWGHVDLPNGASPPEDEDAPRVWFQGANTTSMSLLVLR